jgi:hypothetical protein
MTTVQQIIEAAYARSTDNDPGKLAVDSELIAHLNRDYRARYALWSLKAGDAAIASVGLTLGGNPAAAALPTDIIDIDRIEDSTGSKINLVPINEKNRVWHLAPAVYRQGLSIISRMQAGDPSSGQTLTLFHNDAPAALANLTDTLDVRYPARFELLLILGLAIYLDTKDTGRDLTSNKELADELARYEALFNAEVGVDSSATQRGAQPRSAA